MAEVGPDAKPDLSKVPNFDALSGWVKKLQEWCDASAKRYDDLAGENGELKSSVAALRDEVSSLESEIEGLVPRESWASLMEYIKDVERGIRTGPELFAHIEREGYA